MAAKNVEEMVQELFAVTRDVQPKKPTSFKRLDNESDEVYPNLYIGGTYAAKNLSYLQQRGITHVLNTAEGEGFCKVDTNQEYYLKVNIKYLGFDLEDDEEEDISKVFDDAAAFIEEGLSSGGKVLVHCLMGISRSTTCVLAFLMLKRGYTVKEALIQCRKAREVCPNPGFMQQLVHLQLSLKKSALS